MAGFGGRKGSARCVGLDVGTASVKGLHLHRAGDRIEVVQTERAEIPPGSKADQRSNAVRKVLERLNYREVPLVASVGGPGTVLRRVSLPKMTPQELRSAFAFEAERYIPFKMDEVFFDFSILAERSGGQMDVLLAAARRELVNDLLELLAPCDVTPLAVDLEMVALTNAWIGSSQAENGVTALLHIDGMGTVLDFIRDSQLEFAREISVGGSAFTQAVAAGLHLEVPEAERLKCRPEGRETEVRAAMQPAWEEWLSQCRVSFDFYEHQFGHRVERLVLSGGAARMSGFKDWIQQEASGLPTKVWDPMGNDPSFAIAMGLALRGVQR